MTAAFNKLQPLSEGAIALVEQQVEARMDARQWSENMRVRLERFGDMLERHKQEASARDAEWREEWAKLSETHSWFTGGAA